VDVVNSTTAVNLVIGLAVLAFILYRQMQKRPVKTNMRLPLILAVVGVIQLTQFLQHNKHGTAVYAALVGSLVLAAVFGGIRAATVRVWVDGGQAMRQGTWLTLVLWLVSLGVHLGYDYLVDGKGAQAGLGTASLTLYFAVTYAVQRVILDWRVQRLTGAGGPGQGATATATSPR
jgi:hypothetical protein